MMQDKEEIFDRGASSEAAPVVCPECGCHFSGSLDGYYTVHASSRVTHLSICASQDDTMDNYPSCDCGADHEQMRAAFWAWVDEQGCDTDGAWSAWQGCWNLRARLGADTEGSGQMEKKGL